MRFTKAEVLDMFRRQDAAYRLVIVASHWLRHTTSFKPSAVEEARGLWMEVDDEWIVFSDLAEELERDPSVLVGELAMNQLHTTVRAPFEILSDYCEDYDSRIGEKLLTTRLRTQEWYLYASAVRNAVSHNFRFKFTSSFKKRLPTTWNGMSITADLDGLPLEAGNFWHRQGYKLFMEMRVFAEALPEPPSTIPLSTKESGP